MSKSVGLRRFRWSWGGDGRRHSIHRLGLRQNYAEWRVLLFSWPAALAWTGTLLACWGINAVWGLEIFFLGPRGWFIAQKDFTSRSELQQRSKEIAGDPAAGAATDRIKEKA